MAEERGTAGSFDFCGSAELDIAGPSFMGVDWSLCGAVINCVAYIAADVAKMFGGRVSAWRANGRGPALLTKVCAGNGRTLVHVSSDYMFDGKEERFEAELFSPSGVYGQAKVAGDLTVSAARGTAFCE